MTAVAGGHSVLMFTVTPVPHGGCHRRESVKAINLICSSGVGQA